MHMLDPSVAILATSSGEVGPSVSMAMDFDKLQRKMVAVLRKRELHAVNPNDEEGWAPLRAIAKYLKKSEQEI